MNKQQIIDKLNENHITFEVIRGGRMIQAPAYPAVATPAELEILKSLGFQVSTTGGTWREEFKPSGNAAPIDQSSVNGDWR